MIWIVVLLPLLAGPAVWLAGARGASRTTLATAAGVTLAGTAAFGVAALRAPDAGYEPVAALTMVATTSGAAGAVTLLVPLIALPVAVYAAAHEPRGGLGRLVGGLVAFVGAMELLVVAGDFLTLLIGWELVGLVSWALISHQWRDPEAPAGGAHAFHATRSPGIALVIAAAAVFADAGSVSFDALSTVSTGTLHLVGASVVLAAVAKSGQLPFAPWLYSAMRGPTPVSALLHAATMVAAGVYVLVRLHEPLSTLNWFGPVLLAVGTATALGGGVAAALQRHPKKLLAASTSAHYGLMVIAVGAGYPAVAVVHLVTHAAFKALLFLGAGVAISSAGTEDLTAMRLGRRLPRVAVAVAVGAAALAAVPPLGGAWSKEKVVAAAAHHADWLAVLTLVAGALSAVYATRFHLLAFGAGAAGPQARPTGHPPGPAERAALWLLAAASMLLGLLWLPGAGDVVGDALGGEIPAGAPWELASSIGLLLVAVYGTWAADRRGHLAGWGLGPRHRALAAWGRIDRVAEWGVVGPVLALSRTAARLDAWYDRAVVGGVGRLGSGVAAGLGWGDRQVVDGGVRGLAHVGVALAALGAGVGERVVDGVVRAVAAGTDTAGRDSRRLQTGLAHHYLTIVTIGVAAVLAVAAFWR